MIIDNFIKKSNVLTDGNLPDRAVLTEKLLNVVYKHYEKKGNSFSMTFAELFNSLALANNGINKQRLKESLLILTQAMELKNFTQRDGRKVKWYVGSFLKASIFEDTRDYINFKIDDETIYAIEQLNQYTTIDISTSNQFKTKYGITIWQMYLRYKNQTREQVPESITYQMFSLEELNKKFGTNYQYISQMQRSIERGLKEIEAITSTKIVVKWQKDFSKFGFFWQKEKELPKFETDERAFITYVRTQFVNEYLLEIDNYKNENYCGNIALACNPKGRLYDMYQNTTLNAKNSKQLWTYLFQNQNRIIALKQGTFNF